MARSLPLIEGGRLLATNSLKKEILPSGGVFFCLNAKRRCKQVSLGAHINVRR